MKFPDYRKLMELNKEKTSGKAVPGTLSFTTTALNEAYPEYYFARTSKTRIKQAEAEGYVVLDITFFGDKMSITEFNESTALRFDLNFDKTLGACCCRDSVIIVMKRFYREWLNQRNNEIFEEEHENRMNPPTKDSDKVQTFTTEHMTARQLDESG